MKVSAITVCWNSASVLGRALESLRAQTWPTIEMVIIDGGSTDGTVALARSMARAGDVIVSEADGGIYNAMNKGISLATGDLVYFLNSDDRLYGPDVVADIVSTAQTTAADMIVGDVMMCGDGIRYRKSHAHIRRWNLPLERICHQAAFVRRTMFTRFGGFDERYRICADHEFFVRSMSAGATLKHVNTIVAEFQLGGESSRERRTQIVESADVLRRYRRPHEAPLLLAYRAVRKGYRAIAGHWVDRPA